MKKLPVTILSGFTGAGKTTVLEHLLNSLPGLNVAVIVNDSTPEVLQREIMALSAPGRYDYVLVESTSVWEPMLVAETLAFADEHEESTCDITFIDTMVTVVDAANFLNDFQSIEELQDRGIGVNEDDHRDVAQLLIAQIEFANVILLNKTDLVSEEESGQILAVLRKLNPDARVLAIEYGRVPFAEVVKSGRYQVERAPGVDAWQAMLAGDETTESDAYGISSFVYRARRPFHPQRLWDFWMDGDCAPNILRSKGYFWLATRNAISGFWSHVGQILAAEPGGSWWAETPRAEWPTDDPDLLAEIDSVWDEVWGDRRQELMIISQDLDAAAVRAALNACLLTESEMQPGPSSWTNLEDPFGSWEAGHGCDGSHDHDHG